MLPTFSPSKVFGRGEDILRTLEERLLSLERRVIKDEGFRDARFEKVESEFSRRVSLLEMQVAQMQAELRVKHEIIMRLSGHIQLENTSSPSLALSASGSFQDSRPQKGETTSDLARKVKTYHARTKSMLQVEERHTQRDHLNQWKDQMVIFDKAKLQSEYPSIDMASHTHSRQQIEVLVHEEFKFDRYDQLGLPSGQQS